MKIAEIWSPIIDAFFSWATARANAQRNRKDVQILSQLDCQQLRDIGLTRGQIESFVAERSLERTSPGSDSWSRS
ncbi:DUF1127 domain-containing protein [Roseateles sp. P5_E11]